MDILQRVKYLLFRPREAWPLIEAEDTTAAELYKGYIIPLAAIGPLASIIGLSLIGMPVPGADLFRIPLGMAVVHALVSFLLSLVGLFVMAYVISALAPAFAGRADPVQALKVAAYASTPSWLAGILLLLPILSFLGLLAALYGIYLLYLGLPLLMKVPAEKQMTYTLAIVLASILLFLVLGLLSNLFLSFPPPPAPAGSANL